MIRSLYDEVPITRIEIEKIKLQVGKYLPNDVKCTVRQMHHLEDMVVAEFQTYIAGCGGETVHIEKQWPRDWWQALRERWFPKWWLARHPVQYTRFEYQRRFFERVCPHFSFPDRPGEDRHCLQFLGDLPNLDS